MKASDSRLTPVAYELFVALLAQRVLDAGVDASCIRTGNRCKVRGVSGYNHQIDVVVDTEAGLWLVECKRHTRRVSVEEVLVLLARWVDIKLVSEERNVYAILASEAGLTRNASLLVKEFGIQTESVRNVHEFGFRLGQNALVGVRSGLRIGDHAIAHLVTDDDAQP